MNRKITLVLVAVLAIGLAGILAMFSRGIDISILNPQGWVALQEKNLIITVVLLMALVVVPVYVLTLLIAWKYRASNTHVAYMPDHDRDPGLEIIWWAIPLAIITMLAAVTWKTTHDLDPSRPLDARVEPFTIQVIALDWKWLFIYPEQGIATVNEVAFPAGTTIRFDITADAPMNSFWIPSLGSQIYAMPGMSSRLHLIADGTGSYRGLSANFSGEGFSGMTFAARSLSRAEFDRWADMVRQSSAALNLDLYRALAAPSSHVPVSYYGSVDPGLYNTVVLTYLSPDISMPAMRHD